jgi:Leucine-rich repeat (LRR) protein
VCCVSQKRGHLKEIDISGTKMTDTTVADIETVGPSVEVSHSSLTKIITDSKVVNFTKFLWRPESGVKELVGCTKPEVYANLWGPEDPGDAVIPDQLWQLKHLTKLEVTGHGMLELPSQIGNLTSVHTLSLARRDVGGILFNSKDYLPAQITNLTHLTTLQLTSNYLDALPTPVCRLASLTSLDLSFNALATLPDEFSNLKSLTNLLLENNMFAKVPLVVTKLPNLSRLAVSGNPLTGGLPEELKGLPLRNLQFDDSQLPNKQEVAKWRKFKYPSKYTPITSAARKQSVTGPGTGPSEVKVDVATTPSDALLETKKPASLDNPFRPQKIVDISSIFEAQLTNAVPVRTKRSS